MGAVPVIFCRSNLPGSKLIRGVTWSRWSHVAILDGDEVIEATWARVRVISRAEFLAHYPDHEISYLPARCPAAVMAAARSQVGKPYDFWGAFGLALHRDWQDPSKWWCSELVAYAFDAGGSPLFRAEALSRVTPQHIRMVPPCAQNGTAIAVRMSLSTC